MKKGYRHPRPNAGRFFRPSESPPICPFARKKARTMLIKEEAFILPDEIENPNMRLYWWVAWQNGRTYALGLNRLR